MSKLVKNNLGIDSGLVIYQDKTMFNYSVDTILLGNFVTINRYVHRVLDIGTNNGALALFVAKRKENLIIDAIEIQNRAANLAEKNVTLNHLDHQIRVINQDFNQFWKDQNKQQAPKYDVIVCNPPFYRLATGFMRKASNEVHIATHEIYLNLEQIIAGSAKIIRQRGYLALVIPPSRLVDLHELSRKYNFEPKRIQFIYPRIYESPSLVLVECRFQTSWGTKFLPSIYLHPEHSTKHEYRPEVYKRYRPIHYKEKNE